MAKPDRPEAGSPGREELFRRRLEDLGRPRHADHPPREYAGRLARDFPDAGALLARVAAYEPDGRLRQNAEMLLFVACKDPGFDPGLGRKVARSAAGVLRSALKDPAVSDDRKYHLGPLLAACGVDLDWKEYESCFRDFEGTASRKNAEFLSRLPADLEAVEQTLIGVGLLHAEEPGGRRAGGLAEGFAVAADVIRHNPELGGMLLPAVAAIAAERGEAAGEAEEALRRARREGGPRAAWALGELGRWPGLGGLGEAARALAAEMAAEGVRPHVPYAGVFSHGLATEVDGLGSRNVLLFFRTPDGRMDALVLMPNDEVGIKDAWAAFGSGAGLQERYLESCEVKSSPVSLETGRELVADAMAIHGERGVPPPGRYLVYRPMLGLEPIAPRRRVPNLGAYALELLVRGPELAEGSEALAEDGSFEDFWCATDEAYEFVRRHRRGRRARGGRSRFGEELVDRFIREVAVGERERLLRRMAVNLEVEAWGGRAAEPANRLAARTWVVLSEGVVPFERVPYVRALARLSLEKIEANVSMGFRTQAEANAASTGVDFPEF